LFQGITTFIFPFLAEARKSCAYAPKQYALQGGLLGNPPRWHRNRREAFSPSFLWMSILISGAQHPAKPASPRCVTSLVLVS